jgi:hypothetical protein
MVLSTTARAKSQAAQNESQGGGSKKAGLVPKATSTAGLIAFNVRGLPRPMSFMMAPVSVSRAAGRGIGWRFGER